ncbi:hypothetical protein [Bacteroides sedimenti]
MSEPKDEAYTTEDNLEEVRVDLNRIKKSGACFGIVGEEELAGFLNQI